MQRAASATEAAGSPPQEIELKLLVAARDLPQLRQRLDRFGSGESLDVDNVYFDTADRLLRGNLMALRVRRIGGRWVQTLKTETAARALSARGEWEVPAPRGRLDLDRFPLTPLATLMQAHPQARLQAAFRTRFRRTVWQVDEGAIELALDDGEIIAGEQRAPILELELELKSGAPEALYRLALELTGGRREALALRPAVESKAARGYRLAAGEAPAPAKANARALVGALPRGTALAVALRGVAERATTLLLANTAPLGEADDPEFVHQARVAVRRLRSAARLAGDSAGWPKALDGDLRWIGRRLGAVRDWDVLQAQTLPALTAELPALAGSLAEQARELRQPDDAALQAALTGARFARMALRLLQWSDSAAGPGPTLRSSARKLLARMYLRLVGSAAFFVALTIEEQHRVRIRAKRLRYALDLFAGALPARPTARFVEHLARLQDELGALNDAVVAAALARRLARDARIDVRPAYDWLGEQRQQHALRAEAALAELARLPQPWR